MKSTKMVCAVAALAVVASTMAIPAYALDWKDGIGATHKYNYAAAGEGIESVYVTDANNTVAGKVNAGDNISSSTGTITWKDSYENVTAFYVDTKPGYAARVYVNGKEGNIYSAAEVHEVKVDSTLGNDKTFTIPANNDYDQVFYFTSAGNEAWVKNSTFELVTEKIVYTVQMEDGQFLKSAHLGDEIALEDNNFVNDPKNIIVGYTVNGVCLGKDQVITEEMVAASEGNMLIVRPVYEKKQYPVTINFYKNTVAGEPYAQVEKQCEYGEILNRESLQLAENQFLVGGTSVVVEEDCVVNVISRDITSVSYEWNFTYTGSVDEHIQRVTAQWNNDKATDREIGLNETVTLNTEFAKESQIKFFVDVDKAYGLKGQNLSSKKNMEIKLIEEREDCDVYEIVYTRYSNGELRNDPANEFFTLQTYAK